MSHAPGAHLCVIARATCSAVVVFGFFIPCVFSSDAFDVLLILAYICFSLYLFRSNFLSFLDFAPLGCRARVWRCHPSRLLVLVRITLGLCTIVFLFLRTILDIFFSFGCSRFRWVSRWWGAFPPWPSTVLCSYHWCWFRQWYLLFCFSPLLFCMFVIKFEYVK